MPLHMTGMASRRSLEFGDEEPVKIAVLPLERVLKFNPNHDPQTGRFTEGPGMRQGGTAGAPTEDAFGRPLRKAPQYTGNKKGPQYTGNKAGPQYTSGGGGHPRGPGGGFTTRGALSASGGKYRSVEAAAAAELSKGKYTTPTQRGIDSGIIRTPDYAQGGPRPVPMPSPALGGPGTSKPVPMPNVGGKDVTAPKGQYFDEYGVLQETNPRRSAEARAFHTPGALTVPKQFQFSEAEKRRNYKVMFGHHPGSMDKSGKPTKRSSFS